MRTGDVAGARWTILAVALQVRQLQCHSTELLLARRLKAVYAHAWQNLFAYKTPIWFSQPAPWLPGAP